MTWKSDYGVQRSCLKGLGASGPKGLEPISYSILFYSILFYSNLFYSILFYYILFYSILFYSILFPTDVIIGLLLRLHDGTVYLALYRVRFVAM